ncbi:MULTISPECIES: hypothetical protein [unclassified Nocardioides]|uniref:hypothetical protein n=1 Tax=unclassified Nocardioides TaxID=2615069 RepID=UPI00360AF0D0
MQVLTAVPQLVSFVVAATDPAPKDEDVTAGWLAFAIFIGLILAVAFLGFSLVKQLRKADAAEEAGLYDPSDKKPRPQLTQQAETEAEPERKDDTADNGS